MVGGVIGLTAIIGGMFYLLSRRRTRVQHEVIPATAWGKPELEAPLQLERMQRIPAGTLSAAELGPEMPWELEAASHAALQGHT